MNRITLIVVCVVCVALLLSTYQSDTRAATNITIVCGTLNSDTGWTAAASPYDVCAGGVTVAAGVTLTIQAGVTVQFQSNAGLTANGTLLAQGAATAPITFTGAITTPGSWRGLVAAGSVLTPTHLKLDHVVIDNAGAGVSGSAIDADRAALTLTNSLIRNSAGDGVQTHQLVTTTLQNVQFVNNSHNAIRLIQPVPGLRLDNLSASGNGFDGVMIGGTTYWSGQRHLPFAGLPYQIDGVFGNFTGDVLTIDPGNELRFTASGWLNIGGQLKAIGLPTAPITLTSPTKQPGDWRGLLVFGGAQPASAQLDYATVEYGGSAINGANIEVANGRLIVHHSRIRYSSRDGVRFSSNAVGSILNSQIVSNSQIITTAYGVFNSSPTRAVLATNDWWGDPTGPTSNVSACSTGHGDRVSAGVLYRPVLTNTQLSAEFPLSDAPILTLTPRRWFAPADGLTRVYFDITLRDGNGSPLPGRIVRLSTSLGTAVDGGITDGQGKTLAYLTSGSTGDADVAAALDAATACDGALSPTSKITFTPPLDFTELLPGSPAPYVNSNLVVTPKPTVVGVTSTLRANLTNPYTVPITVNVNFDYVQSSIGLAFGPVAQISGTVIPPSSTLSISVPWLPLISGHYCFQMSYNIVGVGRLRPQAPPLKLFGKSQDNTTSLLGSLLDAGTKITLQQTEISLAAVNWFIDKAIDTDPFGIPLYLVQEQIGWMMQQALEISHNLGDDPPSQDYQSLAIPPRISLPPLSPPGGVSPARAAALENLRQAMADMVYVGRGATTSFDRYGGASAAQDMAWSSQQANAVLNYTGQLGHALITATEAISGFQAVLVAENAPDILITVDDVIAYQARLNTQGFNTAELAGFQSIGLTTDEIEALRQHYLAADPLQLAGNPRQKLLDLMDVFNLLSDHLLHPDMFASSFSVGGGAGLRAAAVGISNTLAQVHETVTTLQLGNPLTQTESIEVRVRRVDLPADWIVSISPAQVILAPDEQTIVTVRVLPGAPTPQGSIPRMAVEGYAGNQLLGGVAINIVVPRYMPDSLRVYLPLIRR